MKRVLACALLLTILAACTGSSYFDRPNCSAKGELCIEVRAAEPISFGGNVLITITISSEKDISDLGVSIYHDANVVLDVPLEWEKESRDIVLWNMGSSWKTTAEAGQLLVFQRSLILPPQKGTFSITVMSASEEFRAADILYIIMTPDGGKVYLSGTGIPRTPGPELVDTVDPHAVETLRAKQTKTAAPTATPTWTLIPTISLTFPALRTLTPTPIQMMTATPTKSTEMPPPVIVGTPAYPPPYP